MMVLYDQPLSATHYRLMAPFVFSHPILLVKVFCEIVIPPHCLVVLLPSMNVAPIYTFKALDAMRATFFSNLFS